MCSGLWYILTHSFFQHANNSKLPIEFLGNYCKHTHCDLLNLHQVPTSINYLLYPQRDEVYEHVKRIRTCSASIYGIICSALKMHPTCFVFLMLVVFIAVKF